MDRFSGPIEIFSKLKTNNQILLLTIRKNPPYSLETQHHQYKVITIDV